MTVLFIAIASGVAFLIAYHSYGRWLGSRIFRLSAEAVCPSVALRDDQDYVPTHKSIVFGHHFTSIAGTGPIVGPAIAVMWGWLPAILWVVLGSIFIGAVHDFASLVISLRNQGQTVGDIAGRVINKRVRLLFLFVLFLALTIVLAIFGLVIAAVFRHYPAAIFPCWVQLPIAVGIGIWLHKKGRSLLLPSIIALLLMYLSVVFGDQNTPVASWSALPGWLASGIGWFESMLHAFNTWAAALPTIVWVIVLLVYSYIASVLPVWVLLQPRDYINSLQLLSALGLIVAGLVVAAFIGGAPPVAGAERQPLELVAPTVDWQPSGAPAVFPFLFITVACGAISGFHCLVSSGTSSKQIAKETDARFVAYGAMLTEGFLAVLVILACCAGLGLGVRLSQIQQNGVHVPFSVTDGIAPGVDQGRLIFHDVGGVLSLYAVGSDAWAGRYESWSNAEGLANTVGAFVEGSSNFLAAIGVPSGVAVALMGVLVASFAGTTLDTACRLQRYVVQELAGTFLRKRGPSDCVRCGYDLTGKESGACPECGWDIDWDALRAATVRKRSSAVSADIKSSSGDHVSLAMPESTSSSDATVPSRSRLVSSPLNPAVWLTNKHGATLFACVLALALSAFPAPGKDWSWTNAGGGGLILWPMFGATNQLLGGLAFLVISFWLWRRKLPVWFVALPLVFMLVMPFWALVSQLPGWLDPTSGGGVNWPLVVIALATLGSQVWMVVEAVMVWPSVRGVLEERQGA
jgi:carbon starvation protein